MVILAYNIANEIFMKRENDTKNICKHHKVVITKRPPSPREVIEIALLKEALKIQHPTSCSPSSEEATRI